MITGTCKHCGKAIRYGNAVQGYSATKVEKDGMWDHYSEPRPDGGNSPQFCSQTMAEPV